MKTIYSNNIPKKINSSEYDVEDFNCGEECLHLESIEGDYAIYRCEQGYSCKFRVKIKKEKKKKEIDRSGEIISNNSENSIFE